MKLSKKEMKKLKKKVGVMYFTHVVLCIVWYMPLCNVCHMQVLC